MYVPAHHVLQYTFMLLLMKTQLVSSSNEEDRTLGETSKEQTDNDTTQHFNRNSITDKDQENAFAILSRRFGSSDGNLDEKAVSNMIGILSDKVKCADESGIKCFDCLDYDEIILTRNAKEKPFTEQQFAKLSTILLYNIVSKENTCKNGVLTYEEAKKFLSSGETICKSHFMRMVTELQMINCPGFLRCMDVRRVFPNGPDKCIKVDDTTIPGGALVTKVINALVNCNCYLPAKDIFLDALMRETQSSNDTMPIKGFSSLLKKLKIGREVEDDHEERKNHRDKRDADLTSNGTKSVNLLTKQCYSASELLTVYGINKESGITRAQFTDLCPSLIQQITSGACQIEPEPLTAEIKEVDSTYTTLKKYGYGTAAVTTISMLAFIGLLVFPALGTSLYKMTMQFFIALGVGTMSGDAILHIIPEVVGLHGHEETSESDDHSNKEGEKLYIWRLVTVIAGIYVFYLFENSIRLWNKVKKTKFSLHAHAHENSNNTAHTNGHVHNQDESSLSTEEPDDIGRNINNSNSTKTLPKLQMEHEDYHHQEENTKVCGTMTTIGIMVLIGDILHNFGDGVALGVAFSSSWVAGVGTSIAIFCHELPHEFGDFAIYLNNGLTKCQALLANFGAACFSFAGLYLGLGVAQNPEIRKWMLAVIAGMFLYIALVDIMHEMMEETTDRPVLLFILQNFGMLSGWTILVLIACYEEDIAAAIGG